MELQQYDPNIRWAKQTVKITLMQWGYKAELTATVGGNCQGFDIFESAISNAYDGLPFTENRHGRFARLEMLDAEGNSLECEDDEEKFEEWLKDMIIAMEIIDQQEDKT